MAACKLAGARRRGSAAQCELSGGGGGGASAAVSQACPFASQDFGSAHFGTVLRQEHRLSNDSPALPMQRNCMPLVARKMFGKKLGHWCRLLYAAFCTARFALSADRGCTRKACCRCQPVARCKAGACVSVKACNQGTVDTPVSGVGLLLKLGEHNPWW